ncbi:MULTISPECIES: phage tail assembly protein [unclassified Haematospirillum]|uniref:phage tail assembly protein n=1 Tax=unclassified Haematospirillum TaxID=2622088 RepID=UPI00143BF934|nr:MULTISPECIES: phage tail assembly protein [unclassified Haematospirillum]NKD55859.1 phage tail assembly protein [Haematospirillum sp. H4890]NKD75934.1 phage tail assembly protein [Haematospirillum sp. H4485]NKD88692.1 phage tail assembly protein [Haematospirillum sp. 15-248]
MSSDTTDIVLDRPLMVDGTEIMTVRMREPTVQDQIAASEVKGSPARQEIAMIANLCEITPDMVRQLSLRDYKKLQQAFLGFTE